MIPVSLPGGNFYVLMAASLACLATLFTWLAALATSPGARDWLSGHRRAGTVLMAVLAVIGAIFPYQQFSQWFSVQREAQADDARKTVLSQPTQLAGVQMPIGTTLRLATPGELASFDRAVFPESHPADIQGVAATRLFRYPPPRPSSPKPCPPRSRATRRWKAGCARTAIASNSWCKAGIRSFRAATLPSAIRWTSNRCLRAPG